MSDEVGMEMPELADLGRRVTAIGERLARDVAEIHEWAYSATGLIGGSHLCVESIGEAADQWRGTLTLLAESIDNFGSGLTRSATEFRVVDGDSARAIKQAGDEQVIKQIGGERAAGEQAEGEPGIDRAGSPQVTRRVGEQPG